MLGGHVRWSAQDGSAGGHLGIGLNSLGQPEVGDVAAALGVDQDVGRLQVAVEDAPHVGVVHRLCRFGKQRRRSLRVILVGLQPLGQAAAQDELHGEVSLSFVLAGLVDRYDARMVQQCDRLGLVLEPAELNIVGQDPGPDHLEGDRPVEAYLEGLVDDPHAAAAQLSLDLVIAEVSNTIAALQTVAGRSAGRSDGCVHGAPVLCLDFVSRGVSRRRIRIGGQRQGRFGGGPRVGRWQHGRLVDGRLTCRTEDVMRSLVSTQQHVNTQPQLGISLTGLVQVRCPVCAGLAVQRGHEDLFDFRSRVAQCSPPRAAFALISSINAPFLPSLRRAVSVFSGIKDSGRGRG